MRPLAHPLVALALAGSATSLTPILAQDATATFAPPVRLKAGDANLGEARLYPSPVYHDVNGDGRTDIVVGDLRGHLTVALRQADGTFGAEAKLNDENGKQIDFHNW